MGKGKRGGTESGEAAPAGQPEGGDAAPVLNLKMDSTTGEAPKEVATTGGFEVPCTITGLGAGLRGGSLGWVFGFGERDGCCSRGGGSRRGARFAAAAAVTCGLASERLPPVCLSRQAATGSAAFVVASGSGRWRWGLAGNPRRCEQSCCPPVVRGGITPGSPDGAASPPPHTLQTFAIMGGLYAAVSCFMQRLRQKNDGAGSRARAD